MTRGQVVIGVLGFAAYWLLVVASVAGVMMMASQGQLAQEKEPQPIPIEGEMRRIGSYMAIAWRTPTQVGMSPREVLESASARMQYEQTTLLGSDANAQALVKVLEAIAILEGRSTETADGFPLIE